MSLDPKTKSRIEAEEIHPAKVRAKDHQNVPNYWSGFLLNMLLPGFGFFLIGEVGHGIMWAVIVLLAAFAGIIPILAAIWFMSLVEYHSTYKKKYSTEEPAR